MTAAPAPASRSALIVKLAAIGDVVLAMPMVTAIRSMHPDARISWMCGASVAPLLACVEGIDECIVVDERAMLAGSTLRKLRAVANAWTRIGLRRFDAVYVAHSDPRYRLLAAPAVTSHRRSLGGGGKQRPMVQRRTHPDEYVRLVTGVDDYRARSFAAPALRLALSSALSTKIERFAEARPLVALIPGGSRNVARENPLRRWPLDRYARLAKDLTRGGLAVTIVGDREDEWVRTAFDTTVLDLIGGTTLVDLAALFRHCAAVVSHDTGPMHLARLVGTEVVALFGPTPPSMFFRKDARTIPLWPGSALPCAPCYDGHEFASCSNNVCMQLIECDTVRELVEKVAAAAGTRSAPL